MTRERAVEATPVAKHPRGRPPKQTTLEKLTPKTATSKKGSVRMLAKKLVARVISSDDTDNNRDESNKDLKSLLRRHLEKDSEDKSNSNMVAKDSGKMV